MVLSRRSGYEYAETETLLGHERGGGSVRIMSAAVETTDVVTSDDFTRADLEVGGIRDTGSSYEGRVTSARLIDGEQPSAPSEPRPRRPRPRTRKSSQTRAPE